MVTLMWPIFDKFRRALYRPRDPFAADNFDFETTRRDDFLSALIQRRQVYDQRLKGKNIRSQYPALHRNTIDDVLLKVAEAHVRLLPNKLTSEEQSHRLDTAVGAGLGEDVGIKDLTQYLRNRIAVWDPKLGVLSDQFLNRHIALCETYAVAQLARVRHYPPVEWLAKKLDPEVVRKNEYTGKLVSLMLPGDELWSYSSPPETWQHLMGRAGVALIRDGKPISEIMTRMN
jgi:hypothetical protein